jgi:hypothetical protein
MDVKLSLFDEIVIKIASDICSDKISTDECLNTILKQIESLSNEDKQQFEYHITKIKFVLESVKLSVNNRQNKTYDRCKWGWKLNKDEMNTLVFPFEWRIHERINNDRSAPKYRVIIQYPRYNNFYTRRV